MPGRAPSPHNALEFSDDFDSLCNVEKFKALRAISDDLGRRLAVLRDEFRAHDHRSDGQAVVPIPY